MLKMKMPKSIIIMNNYKYRLSKILIKISSFKINLVINKLKRINKIQLIIILNNKHQFINNLSWINSQLCKINSLIEINEFYYDCKCCE